MPTFGHKHYPFKRIEHSLVVACCGYVRWEGSTGASRARQASINASCISLGDLAPFIMELCVHIDLDRELHRDSRMKRRCKSRAVEVGPHVMSYTSLFVTCNLTRQPDKADHSQKLACFMHGSLPNGLMIGKFRTSWIEPWYT